MVENPAKLPSLEALCRLAVLLPRAVVRRRAVVLGSRGTGGAGQRTNPDDVPGTRRAGFRPRSLGPAGLGFLPPSSSALSEKHRRSERE